MFPYKKLQKNSIRNHIQRTNEHNYIKKNTFKNRKIAKTQFF